MLGMTTKKILTLCLLQRSGEVLLGMKKRGFGMGKWNGFGGKVEPGETIEDAARREVLEECGITVRSLRERGVMTFTFDTEPFAMEVHVFSSDDFSGEAAETDEMRPQWFSHDAIPFDAMWADDRHWFPIFFAGKNWEGTFHFKDQATIAHFELKEL